MRTQFSRLALSAALALAMALTFFACSNEDSPPDNSCPLNTITRGTFADARDGKSYKWVKICGQTWMAENLNYNASGSRCYDNNEANCTTYGRLYDWATAMGLSSSCNSSSCASQVLAKHQGICPSGWHIPSNADWDALVTAVGGSSTAGTKLKATDGWNRDNDYGRDGNGTDDYGFSALPGGYGNSDGYFSSVGILGIWWNASEIDAYGANYQVMYHFIDVFDEGTYSGSKSYRLHSVRCVKDGSSGGGILPGSSSSPSVEVSSSSFVPSSVLSSSSAVVPSSSSMAVSSSSGSSSSFGDGCGVSSSSIIYEVSGLFVKAGDGIHSTAEICYLPEGESETPWDSRLCGDAVSGYLEFYLLKRCGNDEYPLTIDNPNCVDKGDNHFTCYGGINVYMSKGEAKVDMDSVDMSTLTGTWDLYAKIVKDEDPNGYIEPVKVCTLELYEKAGIEEIINDIRGKK